MSEPTRTVEQIVLALALLERPCLRCYDPLDWDDEDRASGQPPGNGFFAVGDSRDNTLEIYGCPDCGGSGGGLEPSLGNPNYFDGKSWLDRMAIVGAWIGTGQVARFPMLREPCNAISPNITDSRQVNIHMEFCAKCQGRGFLLVITTDALLEAILSVGFEPRIRMWHGQYELCLYQGGGSIPWGDGGDAQDDLRHALALALEAVLQQEAHDAD